MAVSDARPAMAVGEHPFGHLALAEPTADRRCGASAYTSQIFFPARRRVSGVPIHTIALCASQCGEGLRPSG